jgi:hypothetical protein
MTCWNKVKRPAAAGENTVSWVRWKWSTWPVRNRGCWVVIMLLLDSSVLLRRGNSANTRSS